VIFILTPCTSYTPAKTLHIAVENTRTLHLCVNTEVKTLMHNVNEQEVACLDKP